MQTEPQIGVLFFLFLFIISLFFVFFLFNRKKFIVVVSNMRPFRSIHYCGLTLFGVFVGYMILRDTSTCSLAHPSTFIPIAGIIISMFFAFQSAVTLNDVFDVQSDKISNPNRPLIRKQLTKTEMKYLSLFYMSISLLLAISINPSTFALILCSLTLSLIYSVPPIRLKRFFPVSSFILALAALISILLGYSIFVNWNGLLSFPRAIVFFVLIIFTLAVNIKDIKDSSGDKKTGVKTLPVLIGNHKSRIAIGLFVLISYILIVIFLKKPILFIPAILFGIISMVIIVKKRLSEKPVFVLYFLFTLILAFSVRNNFVDISTSRFQKEEKISKKMHQNEQKTFSDLDSR